MYRGSRKHVLDWTGQPGFYQELARMVAPGDVVIPPDALCMPFGVDSPVEARLERFGPKWLPQHGAWHEIQSWWLRHLRGANTPNWDIAVTCAIEGKPGLILVEAKANCPELGRGGKILDKDARPNSVANHERIGAAIEQASVGWKAIDERISISRDSHYQLANRLAFTWKLATLGIPVILVYLGFTGDEGIQDAGEPFADDVHWQRAFTHYAEKAFPVDMMDRRLMFGTVPVWVMSRSRAALEPSPPPSPRSKKGRTLPDLSP